MCGRYTLTHPGDLLEELGVDSPPQLTPRYNVAPTQNAPVVRAAAQGGRRLDLLRWGLVPFWAQDPKIGNRMINARSETAAEKPSFRHALKQRRCVVPADGFYEWKKVGGGAKQPYHIHLRGRRPFVFAGLWERWTKGPEPIESFTILTTSPNDKVAELHDRMPVILPREAWDLWLDPSVGDAARVAALMGPCNSGEITFVPVSKMVNRPGNDRPECVQPIQL